MQFEKKQVKNKPVAMHQKEKLDKAFSSIKSILFSIPLSTLLNLGKSFFISAQANKKDKEGAEGVDVKQPAVTYEQSAVSTSQSVKDSLASAPIPSCYRLIQHPKGYIFWVVKMYLSVLSVGITTSCITIRYVTTLNGGAFSPFSEDSDSNYSMDWASQQQHLASTEEIYINLAYPVIVDNPHVKKVDTAGYQLYFIPFRHEDVTWF